jgi:hypothetical protein
MNPQMIKAATVRLRDINLDEKWLQERIEEDPSLLGFGADVQILRREKRIASGGRIDFVLSDTEQDRYYEVEIMLGKLDESHIIRTIEYWDLERQRYPDLDHRAVIVAEEITSRFFNVIRLLNRAVPLIAIQLTAIKVEAGLILQFTKVLDIYQEAAPEIEAPGDPVNRAFWDKRASAASMAVVDQLVAMITAKIAVPRVTYNKNHIAIGTTGTNFCWLHPPKEAPHCHMRVRTGEETRDSTVQKLSEVLAYVRPFQSDIITIKLSTKDLTENSDLIENILKHCEQESRAG